MFRHQTQTKFKENVCFDKNISFSSHINQRMVSWSQALNLIKVLVNYFEIL